MNERLADAKSRVVGKKQVSKSIKAGELDKIIIAEDADAELIEEIRKEAEAAKLPVEWVRTKKQLGQSCGISVCAACAGIKKEKKVSGGLPGDLIIDNSGKSANKN